MKIFKYETNKAKNEFLKCETIKPYAYKDSYEFNVINVHSDYRYQDFLGFGGAVTQSAGITYMQLNDDLKKEFIASYFIDNSYSLIRIPLGSCDFAEESYSYSYKKDLSDFSIEEDYKHIIPLLQDILIEKPNVQFLASPWSPPKFMKSNKMLSLGGKLKKEFYETYAKYITKYILAYREIGIIISYLTIQNEANAAQIWESCQFSYEEECDFVDNYLIKEFKKHKINTRILTYDHNKEKLLTRAESTINKTKNIDGIAYHYYTGDHFEDLNLATNLFDNKLFIHTEGCVGYSNFKEEDQVLNAEIYAHDILGDLKNGSNGYIDWNILLNHKGGPNHKLNYCDSPIMENKEKNRLIYNLSYHYIKHFSNFILKGNYRIATSSFNSNIETVAFRDINDNVSVVLLNRSNDNYKYNLNIDNNFVIKDEIKAHSIITYRINK